MRDSKVHVIHGKDAQHAAMLRRLLQRDSSPHSFSPNEDTPLFTSRKNITINNTTSPTRSSLPFVIALRLLGCLPLSAEKSGRVVFKFLSPVMAYSLAVYSLAMFATYNELSRRFMFISGKLDLIVSSLMYCVLFLKNIFIPIIMWLPIRRVCNHQLSWLYFHDNYIRVTGEPLRFDMEKYTKYIAVAIPAFALVVSAVWNVKVAPKEPWLMIVYMLPIMTSLALDGLWCTSYICIGMAAAKINSQLKIHLNRYAGEPGVQEVLVREYRALYLEVSRLLQSNNDVSTVTFTYHTGHVFLMLTLSLYGVLSGLRDEWDWVQTVKALATVLFLLELWSLANAAHFTTAKFDEIQWDADWLIPAATMPDGVRKEITTLLEVAAASPRVVDIGGFVTINRSWLTNMLGNLLSSLIILLQFRVSQSGETDVTSLPSTTVAA